MKRVLLVLLLAAGIAGGPARAEDPPPLVLTVANHQQLITVKRQDGRTLYSQKISSANVKLAGARLGKQSRLSLQDMAGKTLWTKTFPRVIDTINLQGDWVDSSQTGMQAVFTAVSAKFPTMGRSQPSLVEMVIGPKNQLVSFYSDFQSQAKPHTLRVECLPGHFMVHIDQKPPFQVPQPSVSGETAPAAGR